jgi:AraC-like DNA-binding protein/mannose-6-phosphate isomerase-like protein (cupin superfamily)
MYNYHDFDIRIWLFGLGKSYRFWTIHEPPKTFIRLYFVFGGRGVYKYEDKSIELKKDHFYLLPSYKPHTLVRYPEEPLDHLWIQIYTIPALIADHVIEIEFSKDECLLNLSKAIICHVNKTLGMFSPNEYRKMNRPDDFRSCVLPHNIPEAYSSMEKIGIFNQAIDTLTLLIKSMILLIIAEENSAIHFMNDEYMTKALDYINTNYGGKINNKMIANIIGLEVKYFISMFKQKMGITPHQYLIYLRLGMADILLEKNQPIYMVAESVGFNPKTFSRIYKRHRRYLPSEHMHSAR